MRNITPGLTDETAVCAVDATALVGLPIGLMRCDSCISALNVGRVTTKQLEDLASFTGHSLPQQRAYHQVPHEAAVKPLVNADGEYTLPMRVGAVAAPVSQDVTADEVAFPVKPAATH